MWQQPQILKDYLFRSTAHQLFMKIAQDDGKETLKIPSDCVVAGDFLISLLNELGRLGSDVNLQNKEMFSQRLFDRISIYARQIDATHNYCILDQLYTVLSEIRLEGLTDIYGLLYTVIVIIHYMVGDETKILVGYSGKTPFFKTLKRSVKSADDLRKMILPIKGQLIWIDNQSDLQFVSDPTEVYKIEAFVDQIPVLTDFEILRSLYQDLKEHFRYAPDPEGTEVVIHGYPLLKSVKIKPKIMNQTGEFGLLIKAEFTEGSLVMVAVDPEIIDQTDIEHGGRPYNFLYFVAWLVYHDLCTAKEIRVNDHKNPVHKNVVFRVQNVAEIKPKFIYIQRTINNGACHDLPVRTECSNRVKCPHQVVGHLRLGRMSDDQRSLVQASLGGQMIMDKIEQLDGGYTYVFPYSTGNSSSGERKWQPIFVEADFMRRLKTALAKTN